MAAPGRSKFSLAGMVWKSHKGLPLTVKSADDQKAELACTKLSIETRLLQANYIFCFTLSYRGHVCTNM